MALLEEEIMIKNLVLYDRVTKIVFFLLAAAVVVFGLMLMLTVLHP